MLYTDIYIYILDPHIHTKNGCLFAIFCPAIYRKLSQQRWDDHGLNPHSPLAKGAPPETKYEQSIAEQ